MHTKITRIILPLMILVFFSCEEFSDMKDELNITVIEIDNPDYIISSVGEMPSYERVHVYPNPFVSQVFIDIWKDNAEDIAKIVLSDEDGKMKVFETDYDIVELDFSKCPQGIYYCEVLITNTVFRRQLIKQE